MGKGKELFQKYTIPGRLHKLLEDQFKKIGGRIGKLEKKIKGIDNKISAIIRFLKAESEEEEEEI